MYEHYTFLMISTINSTYGTIDLDTRFQQTLEAIDSVNRKVPGCKILFVDNSNITIKDEWRQIIESKVTVFHQLEHNLFSLVNNIHKMKSASETNMMFRAFDLLRQHNLLGKRIFKLSGRYKLADSFDISFYDNPAFDNKYTFLVKQWASTYDNWLTKRMVMRLETALISFTPFLIDEFQSVLPGVLWQTLKTDDCIEEALFEYIPHDKIAPLNVVHVEGFKAEGGFEFQ